MYGNVYRYANRYAVYANLYARETALAVHSESRKNVKFFVFFVCVKFRYCTVLNSGVDCKDNIHYTNRYLTDMQC